MESYSGPPETRKSFVLTKDDSLDDVRAAIQSAMDNQTTATLETAKWLGQSLNTTETSGNADQPASEVSKSFSAYGFCCWLKLAGEDASAQRLIERAGLSGIASVYSSAIEINTHIKHPDGEYWTAARFLLALAEFIEKGDAKC